jgi:hypothetical protein
MRATIQISRKDAERAIEAGLKEIFPTLADKTVLARVKTTSRWEGDQRDGREVVEFAGFEVEVDL